MLKPNTTSDLNDQVQITSELFGNLKLSLDSKFLKQSHITQKPRLKRLLRGRSPSASVSINAATFCSRCQKETTSLLQNERSPWSYSIPEKEVEVRKEKDSFHKRVSFIGTSRNRENTDESVSVGKVIEIVDDCQDEEEPVRPKLQKEFFAKRSLIVGNNQFWLPNYSLSSAGNEHRIQEDQEVTLESGEESICADVPTGSATGSDYSGTEKARSALELDVIEFFNSIFKETIKRHAKILHVATMLENSLVTLTDEYIFECRRSGSTFEIMNAIPLKDVQTIMTNEDCTLLVIRVCRASTLTEFKEFVPGIPEKTESLISLMVFALSRINGFLPDVKRLPLMALPNFITVQTWFIQQDEEIAYCGIATAKHISDQEYDFSGESFMMSMTDCPQFHPVGLLLKYGQVTTECNGGCDSGICKYSVVLELKDSVVIREDHPWPNSVRLRIGSHKDVIVACSSKECSDELVEKLYSCIQSPYQDSVQCLALACVLVTEYTLELFRMTQNKPPLFGSPLLNLNISSQDGAGHSCLIETEGVEA